MCVFSTFLASEIFTVSVYFVYLSIYTFILLFVLCMVCISVIVWKEIEIDGLGVRTE